MRLILFFPFLLIATFSCTQKTEPVRFDVITTNFATQKKEAGVTVSVIPSNSKKEQLTVSDSLGRCFFSLQSGSDYKLIFSKKGMVTRFATVTLADIAAEDVLDSKCKTAVTMYDKVSGVDYSFLRKNPMTTFYLDTRYEYLVYDTTSAEKTWEAVDNIAADIEELQKKQIAAADVLYAEGKYKKALKAYQKALKFMNNQHVVDQIKKTEQLLKKED